MGRAEKGGNKREIPMDSYRHNVRNERHLGGKRKKKSKRKSWFSICQPRRSNNRKDEGRGVQGPRVLNKSGREIRSRSLHLIRGFRCLCAIQLLHTNTHTHKDTHTRHADPIGE